MTLDELLAKVPEQWRPVAAEYGPALLAMTAAELWAWIDLLAKGKQAEAYAAVLAKMGGAEIVAEWNQLAAEWSAVNAQNAAKVDLSKRAIAGILKVLLTISLALVGL